VTGMTFTEIQTSARVNDAPLANRGMTPYAVADPRSADSQLTVRSSRGGVPLHVPRDQWGFGRFETGVMVEDPARVFLKRGFEPGALYQISYRAKDPTVVGLGLASVRDLMSWIRYDASALVRGVHVYAFGISQTGRFLRQFLHDGFNADTSGRQVFEAMM